MGHRRAGSIAQRGVGGLTLYVEEGEWLRLRDAQGQRLPSAEEEAERAEREAARAEQAAAARQAAEAELERLRALLRQQDTS